MTGIFYERDAATSAFAGGFSPGARAGIAESFEAAFAATQWLDTAVPVDRALREAYDPIVAALNAERDPADQLANPYGPPPAGSGVIYAPSIPEAAGAASAAAREERIWAEIAARRAADPQALPGAPADRDALWAPVLAEVDAAVARDTALTPRMHGLASVAGLAGQFAGWLTDPGVALGLGAGSGAASVLRLALQEAAIGGVTEAALLPGNLAQRERVGHPLTAAEAALQVAGGAVGGGVVGGGLGLLGLAGRGLLRAFDRAVPTPTREQAAARESVEAATVLRETNPLGDGPAAANEHAERLIGAMRAAAEGTTPEAAGVAARPARPVVSAAAEAPPVLTGPGGAPLTVQRFDPRALELDPETFQFKAGGDAQGVLETLAGVPAWDPIRGGLILVWERADGRLFVADGHQRTGLARRLLEESGPAPDDGGLTVARYVDDYVAGRGRDSLEHRQFAANHAAAIEAEFARRAGGGAAPDPGADIALQGYVLREADGISAEMARAVAAARNIAEGSGSIVDAAKVLRVNPALLMTLPPRSALLRTARHLLPLSDDAFGLVVNDIVDPRWAAIVGRLIPEDQDLGNAVMALLARLDPDNANQAEAIVRQAMAAGMTREQQLTLFGEETVARSLFTERSRVLDGTIRALKRDRALFNQLVAGRETAEAAGNRLATRSNAERATQDAQAIDTLQRLAHRRGPLSDALSAAARQYGEDGRLGPAVATFRDAVRDAVARGDFAGDRLGRGGDGVGAAGEGAAQPGGGAAAGEQGSGAEGAVAAAERAQDERFADPAGGSGSGQDAQLAALERDLRARLDAADPKQVDAGGRPEGAAVPIGESTNADGELAAVTMTERQMLDEIEADRDFVEQAQLCLGLAGGGT